MKSSSLVFVAAVVAAMLPAAVTLAQPGGGTTGPCIQCENIDGHAECVTGWWMGGYGCEYGGNYCRLTGACNHNPGGCFVAGTLITTPDGHRAIEDLRVGDEVVGWDEVGGQARIGHVTRVYRVIELEYLAINDDAICVTSNHPFLVDGTWKTARELEVGDELMAQSGERIVVRSIDDVSRGVRVYNIEVAETGTFFANGVLVHNKSQPGEE